MNTKLIHISLFFSTLLSGFYAGIGFFGFIGFNPAIEKLSSSTFAEYWQHLDFYMGQRMPIFAPLLLITLLITTIILIKYQQKPAYWLLIAALSILVADAAHAVTTNLPLNTLIQSWDLNNLPDNVPEIKGKVVAAFWLRNSCMIGSFILVLLALFLRRK